MSAHQNSASRNGRAALSMLLSICLAFAGIPQAAFAQGGLSFNPVTPNVILDKYKMGETFRYSVCTGQFLGPNDASPMCNKNNAKSVSGGHNAPYVFSTGVSFLPPGVHLDANGVLSGVVTEAILEKPMTICVRQLNEQANCRGLGKFTGIQTLAAGGASTTAAAPPASTPGAGAVLGAVGVAVAVAGAVGLAAAAAGSSGGSSGSSTVRCSQRTCIASGFSCSCNSDSNNTDCPTTFPVAGQGQSCITVNTNNRSAWCAPGLSCINATCTTRQGC